MTRPDYLIVLSLVDVAFAGLCIVVDAIRGKESDDLTYGMLALGLIGVAAGCFWGLVVG